MTEIKSGTISLAVGQSAETEGTTLQEARRQAQSAFSKDFLDKIRPTMEGTREGHIAGVRDLLGMS